MKVGGLVILLVVFLGLDMQAQHVIGGRVFDGNSKQPLPFANVFIANSTKGVQTDLQGDFSLSGIKPGRYKLVISFIGYETHAIDLLVPTDTRFVINLKPSVTKLDEVTITAARTKRGTWYDNLLIFKDNFIGVSENSAQCSIVNPRSLEFTNENNILTAVADSMLIIDNHGLGYRMKFQLEDYILQQRSVRIKYFGYVVYEHLQPSSDREAKIWAERRLRAWYGSRQHFIQALRTKSLMENGFYVNLITTRFNNRGKLIREGIADTTFTVRTGVYSRYAKKFSVLNKYDRILDSLEWSRGRATMKFQGELEVQYINEQAPYNFLRLRSPKEAGFIVPQRSNLKLRAPIVEISSNGQIVPDDGIETFGYWSWELVAESLPLDYDPKADEQILKGIESRGSE